jgi:hypothetical protein
MSAERFKRVNQLVHTIFERKFYVAGPYGLRKIRYHIKYERNDADSCLIMDFEPDFSNLHIDSLAKCGPNHDLRSGTMLLNMVDALTRLIPECKTITLQDASTVRRCSYKIDLASLTILLTGISWYNRLGYKQRTYESDKEHNHRLGNMRINDAVTELLASSEFMEECPYYSKFVKYKKELDTRLNLVNANLTVSEYIKNLYDDIKTYPEYECIQSNKRNAKLVAYVINAFEYLLHYSRDALTKQVVHGKHIPPFINPSTMLEFEFEPEDIFNCGQCGMELRGDDLPPWNAEPKGVKYYTTRGEGEHKELICHKCATTARSPKAATRSPKTTRSPKADARSPKADARSPKAANSPKAAKSPKATMSPKPSSASGGGAKKSRTKRCKPMRRTRRRK